MTGPESDKFGNYYEGLWTVLSIIDVLDERADSICLEILGDEGEGVEFRLTKDGVPEFHQVKRQTTRKGGWTSASLKEVLRSFMDKLKVPNSTCVFVSSDPTGPIRELSNNARGANSWEEFEEHYLSKGSRGTDFDDLRQYLPDYSDQQVYEFLKRTQFRNNDEQTLREYVDRRLFSLTQGKPSDVRRCLAEVAQTRLHHELYATDLWKILEEEGFRRQEWSKDPHVAKLVSDTNQRYVDRILRYAIGGNLIHREETAQILPKLLDSKGKRVVLVTGHAGLGKTGVILDVFQHLQEKAIPALAIRIDGVTPVSHPDQLGEKIGLPGSPLRVLKAIAKNRPCVLVIDQLDAVSLISGRNPYFFLCLEEILNEAALDPQIHLLLGCRKFDLINDYRLMKLVREGGIADEYEIGLLPQSQVSRVLGEHGLDPRSFSNKQLEILSLPLHLWLLLQTGTASNSEIFTFEDEHTLFNHYWQYKEQQVKNRSATKVSWAKIICKLCEHMSDNQALTAPKALLDDFSTDARLMASENVLVFDGDYWSFFHEGFFDYAFARSFVSKEQNLLEWLKGGEQHLFKRAQVRQILRFMRTPYYWKTYLSNVAGLISDPEIRFHIKQIVFAILADLKDPTEEEWNILAPFVGTGTLVVDRDKADPHYRHVWKTIRDSVPWFDLLDSLGVIERWLSDSDETRVDQTVQLLSGVLEQRDHRVAELVNGFLNTSEKWNQRLGYLIQMSHVGGDRKFFDLCLEMLDEGLLDEMRSGMIVNSDFWFFFRDLPTRKPTWACELIDHYFKRRMQLAINEGKNNPFEKIISETYNAKTFFNEVATREPRSFCEVVIDFMLPMLDQTAGNSNQYPRLDPVWGMRMLGECMGPADALLEATEVALAKLANDSIDSLREIIARLLDSDLDSIRFIIIRAYSTNGMAFADEAANYLLRDLSRFKTGYANCAYWATRMLLEAITPYCSETLLRQIESTILHRLSFWGGPEDQARSQFTLLDAVDGERRSQSAWIHWIRISELLGLNAPRTPKCTHVEIVESPVPADEVMAWSNEQWLIGVAQHKGTDFHVRRPDGKLGGGAYELSLLLEDCVRRDPIRFARLVQEFPNNINHHYYDAVLRGLAKADISAETIADICRICHSAAGPTSGRWICHLVGEKAHLQIPEDIIEIVLSYITSDIESPGEVATAGMSKYPADSSDAILSRGINSTRGAAALAIGYLLQADYSRLPILLSGLERIIEDPSAPLRACVAFPLRVMLIHEPETAVALLRTLCRADNFCPTLKQAADYLRWNFWVYVETWKASLMRKFFNAHNRSIYADQDTNFLPVRVRIDWCTLRQLYWGFLKVRFASGGSNQTNYDEDLLLGTQHISNFLYQAVQTNFKLLNDVVWRMIKSPNDDIRMIGAHTASLAALRNPQAQIMVSACLAGDPKQRVGAAEVFASNIRWQGPSSYSAECLRKLFHDCDGDVRTAAARCFNSFRNEELGDFVGLVEAFVGSPAFVTYPDALIEALDQSTAKLPDVTCHIGNTFLDRLGAAVGDTRTTAAHLASNVGKLVIRLYSQTDELAISSRCLDIIDKMAALDAYGVEKLMDFDRKLLS